MCQFEVPYDQWLSQQRDSGMSRYIMRAFKNGKNSLNQLIYCGKIEKLFHTVRINPNNGK